MARADRNYAFMCAEGERIRLSIKSGEGDRVFMLGRWHYPPVLLTHLIMCDECDKLGEAAAPTTVSIEISPAEVRLLIEALEELGAPDDRRRLDAKKETQCSELCCKLQGKMAVGDLTREHQI